MDMALSERAYTLKDETTEAQTKLERIEGYLKYHTEALEKLQKAKQFLLDNPGADEYFTLFGSR